MIALILLFSGILCGVLLLVLLYFLVISAANALDQDSVEPKTSGYGLKKAPTKESAEVRTQRAVIRCAAYPPLVPYRYKATGYTECRSLNMVFGGNLSCTNGCLGLGSCAKSCPNDAIVFRYGEVYISGACDGCGLCVDVCPKKLIELVNASNLQDIECAASGKSDSSSLCPIALNRKPYTIDYRNFPRTGFKILHK